jgi:anaerobic ribonucleoside-triphosphate reductase activating protein
VSAPIIKELNWIKTGKWESSLGGLKSSKTNQKFIDIKTNTILNNLFTKAKTHD